MSEKSEFILSICIPTYNRGPFLEETLESIIHQVNNVVEIVILDSGSTDNTREIVNYYIIKYPEIIKYYYNTSKMGIDIDMAKTVEFAHGEYCWLLSSDDALTNNAIEKLLKAFESKNDIYLCYDVICDYHLKPIKSHRLLNKNYKNEYKLYLHDELYKYLKNCTGLSSVFSFMSIIIFKKSEWDNTNYDNTFSGTGYAHITRIFDIISNKGILQIIKNPLILNRSFNDSFLEMGAIKRFLLDVDGFMKLANRLFPNDDHIEKVFLKILVKEHPWYRILKLRYYVKDIGEWQVIKDKLIYCGFNKCLLAFCSFFSKQGKIINYLIKIKHKYNKAGFHKYIYKITGVRLKN